MSRWIARTVALALATAVAVGCSAPGAHEGAVPNTLLHSMRHRTSSSPIQHVIVIMQENRSFDNLFHGFPGANTVNFGWGHGKKYMLQQVHLKWTWDLRHDHLQFLEDYEQGKGAGFDQQIKAVKLAAPSCSDGRNQPSCWVFYKTAYVESMAYSYVNPADIKPYWTMAQQYALGDNTFSSNNGPSFPSHQYLIAGQSGHVVEVPTGQPWGCDADYNVLTWLLQYGQSQPPVFSKATGIEVAGPGPCFNYPTIAPELDNAGVTWRYYVAATGSGINLSAFEAISPVFYGPDWANVVHPETKVLGDIKNGALQQVSWVMPSGKKSDHAGPDSGKLGPDWVASIVNAVGESPYWNNTAIIIMWDEWGGWYDHVHPKQYAYPGYAREGLGFRVPLIVVSPYAKANYISHQPHEIASTLHFIENTFGLPTLGGADLRADAFDDMFDFTQTPIPFQPIPTAVKAKYFIDHPDNTPGDDD